MAGTDFFRAGVDLSTATRTAAAAAPDRVIVRHRGETLTLAELDARADALAGGLQAEGLAPGAVVAVSGAGRIEFVTALVAVARAGGVAAVVPAVASPVELPPMTTPGPPRFVLTTNVDDAVASALAAHHRARRFAPPGWPQAALRRADPPDPGAPAMVLFTSGTTGSPKAVVRTHASVMSHGVLQVDELGLDPASVLGTVQLSHEAPAQAVAGGGCFVVVDGVAPATWLAAVQRERITHLGASPPLLRQWFTATDRDEYDLTSLRSVVSAAMPLPPDLRAIVEGPGRALTDLYGTVEAGVVALNGRVVRGKEIRVDNDGELFVRPTGAAEVGFRSGYAGHSRWLATGDRARNVDGGIEIIGRTIDTINVAGTKVYAPQVERVIRSHPAVIDVAVVGIDDARHGQVVACAVIVRDGSGVGIRELKDHCRSRLAEPKVPRVVAIRAEFPRTVTGKVDTAALRRQLQPHT